MHHLLNLILAIPVAFAQTPGAEESETVNIFTYILGRLPLWITAVIVLALSLIIAFIVKKGVENRLASKIEEEHQELLIISGRISFVAVSVIGITIALAIAGIDLTAMLAALAFGISFGLQDTIANFVAGLALLASRPFTIGDFIKVNDKMGKVMEIRTRATYLKTIDGLRLIVPNAELYKSSVLSYTSNPMRRIKVPVYCRYGINMEEAIALCLKIVKQHSQALLEPKASVYVADMADYYIELGVRFWVIKGTPWFKLKSKIFMEIEKALEESGMDAPYPVTSLSMEEDVENAVVKTYSMTKDDVKELETLRERYYEELAKAKEVYTSEDLPLPAVPTPPDQSGESFLKGSKPAAAPPAAPAWLQKAAAPPTPEPAPLTTKTSEPAPEVVPPLTPAAQIPPAPSEPASIPAVPPST